MHLTRVVSSRKWGWPGLIKNTPKFLISQYPTILSGIFSKNGDSYRDDAHLG
jgi:hypothetical protein